MGGQTGEISYTWFCYFKREMLGSKRSLGEKSKIIISFVFMECDGPLC